MIKKTIKPQMLLSTLWIFILFNMIFRDLHEFLNQGYIEELTTLNLSEEVMLFYGFILEIPILMVLLSRILNDKTNKWVNIAAVSIVMIGLLSTLSSADLDDIFFAVMNSAACMAIIRTSWKLAALHNTKAEIVNKRNANNYQ